MLLVVSPAAALVVLGLSAEVCSSGSAGAPGPSEEETRLKIRRKPGLLPARLITTTATRDADKGSAASGSGRKEAGGRSAGLDGEREGGGDEAEDE